MKSKPLIVVCAVVVIALALLMLRWQFTAPVTNLRPSTAAGDVLAEETARLLSGKGTVVVIGRAPPRESQTAGSEQVASFEVALKRRGSLKIAATEWLPRAPGPRMSAPALTEEQLLALIEKNPEAGAVVVFTGLPPVTKPLADKIAARSLKVLAVCGYSVQVRRWLEKQALAVVAVPRFSELPPGTPAPKTVKDWFAQEFELLTPESVGRLPY